MIINLINTISLLGAFFESRIAVEKSFLGSILKIFEIIIKFRVRF